MEEQVKTPESEPKVPSKEEFIAHMKEQIEIAEIRLKLQELNTNIAKARAEELNALSFIGNITNPKSSNSGPVKHTVTQEDLDNNPDLKEMGVSVGEEIMIPAEMVEEISEEKPARKLKRN